jgi:hypothetical protein
MSQPQSISQMLTLRKLTRAVADHLTQQLRSHLATVAPLINPRNVFGVHLRSTARQSVKGEDDAFAQLKKLYVPLAGSAPFNLRKDLESPLDIVSILPEIVPVDYAFDIQDAGQNKTITITSPLKWVLTFSGNSPKRLRDLLAQQKTIVGSDLQQCVLSYLMMHVTLQNRPGVTRLLEALRFPVTTGTMEGFGDLPITYIECPVTTILPTNEVILESTEISGSPAFEEVVSPDAIAGIKDPFKEQLLALSAS